nr:ATP-binding cassette domain-containing protein [Blautia argi]
MKSESILSVKDLSVSFHMYEKGLEQYDLKVISNMTLDVRPGEIVAIAGSSGSGKSLLAHAVMGLLPDNASVSGEISYKGKVLSQKDKEALRGKEFALVPSVRVLFRPIDEGRSAGQGTETGQSENRSPEKDF